MNCGAPVRFVSAVAFLLAPFTAAAAGELGPTSRGTVAISVTIPPHVSVRPSDAGGANQAPRLCMAANVTGEYRLAIAGPSDLPVRGFLPARSGECLAPTAAALGRGADSAAPGPITLLIVAQ
jgi:hypothetical protein